MCVVSMVYDHFKHEFDDWSGLRTETIVSTPTINLTPSFVVISQEEIASIRSLIQEFREAVTAAKVVDKLTNQPDCEDPEKKKLEDRVAELESRLTALESK